MNFITPSFISNTLGEASTWKLLYFQRVSKQFSLRLEEVFWSSFPTLYIKLAVKFQSLYITIGEEIFESIDSNALKGWQQRGLKRSTISFGDVTAQYLLPNGFADLGA